MATQQNILINDDSEDGLTKAMMLLDRAIYQGFRTRTNNRLSISLNVVQSGPVDVQGKKNENVGTNDGNVGNDEIKLQMLRDMKESCNKNLQKLKKVVVVVHPGVLYTNENEHAFKNTKCAMRNFMSVTQRHSDRGPKELRKQCEACLTDGNLKSLDSSMFQHYLQVFQEYTQHDIKSIKNILIRYLNAIEKEVDAKAHHEEELRITE
ncbi:hypothetical protein Tco_0622253 [Tanacetum coccineum]